VSHVEVAMPLVDAGVSVLVEKPLASSLEEADRLIEGASRGGVVLAAGHTERFNPAVVAALPLVSDPRFVEIHRLGTFPGTKPRHRRGVRLDDSRPRSPAGFR
jgi:predicted dehydrogenase